MYLGIRAQGAQVALQVSVGHELHHHQGGLTFRDNTQQTHLEDKQEWISSLWDLSLRSGGVRILCRCEGTFVRYSPRGGS